MPRVRNLQRTIAPTAISGRRRTAAATALSEGAPLARARGDLAGTRAQQGQVIARVGLSLFAEQEEERRRQSRMDEAEAERLRKEGLARGNRSAGIKADHQLAQFELEEVYGENGVLRTRLGANAMGVPEEVLERFKARGAEIMQGLANEDQRVAFEARLAGRMQALGIALNKHAHAEMLKDSNQETMAYVDAQVALAVAQDDPFLAEFQLRLGLDQLREMAPDNGWGEFHLEGVITEKRSEAVAGMVARQVDRGNTAGAQEIYDKIREQETEHGRAFLTRQAHEAIAGHLNAGAVTDHATRAFDRIMATPDLTPAQRRTAAQAIKDSEVRRATLAMVEHENAVLKRQEDESLNALYEEAFDIISTDGGSIDRIPRRVQRALNADQLIRLQNYAKSKAAGMEVDTVPAVYDVLAELSSGTEEQRVEFMTRQLSAPEYVTTLTPTDRKHFVDLQAAMRKGDRDKVESLSSDDAEQRRIENEALESRGFDPNPPAPGRPGYRAGVSERIAVFRNEVRKAVRRHRVENKNRVTDEDYQAIVDHLLTRTGQRAEITGPNYFGADLFAFEVIDNVTVDDIEQVPPAQVRAIREAIGRENDTQPSEVLDEQILFLYNLDLSRSRGQRVPGRRIADIPLP